MGGESTNKGILVQTMMAILEALTENDWSYIELEKVGNEKVDIYVSYDDYTDKVIQVKHTKNTFQLHQVQKWYEELVEDNRQANYFKLILLGEYGPKTKNEVEKDTYIKNSNLLKEFESKIAVPYISKLSDAEDYDKLNPKLNAFLVRNKYKLYYDEIIMISKSLIGSFFEKASFNKKITRGQFVSDLLKEVDLLASKNTNQEKNFKKNVLERAKYVKNLSSRIGNFKDKPTILVNLHPLTENKIDISQDFKDKIKPIDSAFLPYSPKQLYTNLQDGIIVFHSELGDDVNSYIQLNDNGDIELADTRYLTFKHSKYLNHNGRRDYRELEDNNKIAHIAVMERIEEIIKELYSNIYLKNIVSLPIKVSVTLINSQGKHLFYSNHSIYPIEYNTLYLGDFKIYGENDIKNLNVKLKEVFQTLIDVCNI